MKKPIFRLATLMLLFTVALSNLNAQVTVGGNSTPNATLDVVAIPSYNGAQGVIAPNLAISVLDTYQAAYTTAQTGAIVYVKDISAGSQHAKTAKITEVGYYYFDGSVWQPFGGGGGCSVTTNVIRGNHSGAVFTSGQFTAQQTVLLHYGAMFLTNLTLPALNNTTDVGKTLIIANRGTDGAIQVNLLLIKNTDGTPYTTNLPTIIPLHRSRAFMWIGDAWIETGV